MAFDKNKAAAFLESDDFKKLSPDEQKAVVGRMRQLAAAPSDPGMTQFGTPGAPGSKEALQATPGASMGAEIAGGVGRAAKSILYDFPKSVITDVYNMATQPKDKPLTERLGPGVHMLSETYEAGQRARKAREQETSTAGKVLATAENAPIIGPMVQHAEKGGTEMFSPESVGAATEATSLYLAPEAARKTVTGARVTAQEVGGAGREVVAEAERARLRKISTQQAKYEGDLRKAEDRYQSDLKEHQATTDELLAGHQEKLRAAKAEYEKAVAEHDAAETGKKAAHAEKVAKLRQEWTQKALEADKSAEEAIRVKNRREALENGQNAYADRLHQNIQSTFKAVKGSLDERWNQLRDAVGKDTPLHSQTIDAAIKRAEQDYLLGSPESIKTFRDLVRQVTDKSDMGGEIDMGHGKTEPMLRPMTWEEGRVYSSTLGDRLYSGEIAGNVLRAVRHVRETIENELGRVADSKGAGAEYRQLKSDWKQFENDWRDTGAVATGGSPLARLQQAPSAVYTKQGALAKSGELLMQTLARYKKFGANPQLVAETRRMNAESKALPKARVSERPVRPKLPPPPQPGTPPEMKAVKPPEMPEPPTRRDVQPPKTPPPVSPYQVRLRRLEQMSGRPLGWFDTFPPRLIERLLLKSERFRDWVARQPRNELPVKGLPPPPSSAARP